MLSSSRISRNLPTWHFWSAKVCKPRVSPPVAGSSFINTKTNASTSSKLQQRFFATKSEKRVAAANPEASATASASPKDEQSPNPPPPDYQSPLNHASSGSGSSPRIIIPHGFSHTSLQTSMGEDNWTPVSLYSAEHMLRGSKQVQQQMELNKFPLNLEESHNTHLFDPNIHLPSAPTDWSSYEASTPLSQALIEQIGVSGTPISTAEYMRQALVHPDFGYYTNATSRQAANNDNDFDDFDRDDYEDTPECSGADPSAQLDAKNIIIGQGGDFVTAPEISNLFGESLVVWFATQWEQQQQQNSNTTTTTNAEWQWVECGPGKGSLMLDMMRFLRVTGKAAPLIDQFGQACRQIHFVEASPVLRKVQEDTLRRELKDHVTFKFHSYGEGERTPATATAIEEAEANPGHNQSNVPAGTEPNSEPDPNIMHVHWHDSFAAFDVWQQQQQQNENEGAPLKPLSTFVVCQEFIDALPVYAFEKNTQGSWRERLVDVALREDMMEQEDVERERAAWAALPARQKTKKPRLRIVLAPAVTPALKVLLGANEEGNLPADETANTTTSTTSPQHMNVVKAAPSGSVVEVCPEGVLLAQDIARIIERQGGAALIIDYGQEGSSDTIRAFTKHEQVHFLSRPGEVDVTADVDFAALRHAVETGGKSGRVTVRGNKVEAQGLAEEARAHAFGPVSQGEFLMAMGIQDRVINLIESEAVSDEQAEDLYNALIRLASPEEMGERYKVLAITRKKDGIFGPPGF